MKYTTKREENTLKITFSMTSEEWSAFDQKAYEQNKGKYNIPGFRKGHVPKRVIENNYGKGVFFEDALYLSAQEYFTQYLDKNSKVEIVARPTIDPQSVKIDEKGTSYVVLVTVRPEVKLGDYKGLTIAKTKPETVKVADVDAEIAKVRERNARFVEVTDRAVADGDEINLDYCGKVDGVAFDGGTAEKQTLVIGSHTFIPGFEEQMVGMNKGETKDIEVTFPTEYHSAELAGKQAVFTVTVNDIHTKVLPELDDEFAKDVSEYETLKEYKDSIKKQLKQQKEKLAENKDETNLIDTIVANASFTVPDAMIEEQIDEEIEEFKYNLMYQGLSLENYYKYTNSTEADLRKQYKEKAEKMVRTRLVFEEIVKVEKIKVTQKETDAKIKDYADSIGKTLAEVKQGFQPQQLEYFKSQATTEKLLEFLKKENTIA